MKCEVLLANWSPNYFSEIEFDNFDLVRDYWFSVYVSIEMP